MPQFTLYANSNPRSKKTYPYFVDVQNDLLDDLNTRVVIPLVAANQLPGSAIDKLCPIVSWDGEQFVLLTHQMTSVPVSALKAPVASLEHIRDTIVAAIDFLVTGI